MRVCALLGTAAAWIVGCSPGPFVCASSEQCIDAGRSGVCEPSGFCSFPDPSCPSGRRYGDHAGGGRAGRCVDEDTGDDGSSGVTVTADSETGTTSGVVSGSSDAGSTTDTDRPSTTEEDAESTESEPLDPDLVAWYRFEGRWDATIEDSSGNGLHGTCDACPVPTLGVIGQAASFDGETQFVQLPDSPSFDLTEAFTLAAWAKLDAWAERPAVSAIVGRPVGDSVYNSWEIYGQLTASGIPRVHYSLSNTPSSSVDASVVVADSSAWLHVALAWDGSTARMYLDGEVSAERSITNLAYDEQAPRIGADFDWGEDAGFLMGAIDEVRIYSRALSDEEIAMLAAR